MADIKQVYPKISAEVNTLEAQIRVAEDNIAGFKRTTNTMEWYGDAREKVDPIIADICQDIVELKKFVTELKEDANVTAEKMQTTSHQNVQNITDIKNA